jgi:hypothetical protein
VLPPESGYEVPLVQVGEQLQQAVDDEAVQFERIRAQAKQEQALQDSRVLLEEFVALLAFYYLQEYQYLSYFI